MSEVFRFERGLQMVSLQDTTSDDLLKLDVGGKRGVTEWIYLNRDAALSLARALIEHAAPETDGEWGPMLPWRGGECPLDEWERQNHFVVLALEGGVRRLITSGAMKSQWEWLPGFSRVVYYCVRKRPPAPVEEWVTRTVVVGEYSTRVQVLVRDGVPTGDVRTHREAE